MYFCVALTVPSRDSRAEGSDSQWTVAAGSCCDVSLCRDGGVGEGRESVFSCIYACVCVCVCVDEGCQRRTT